MAFVGMFRTIKDGSVPVDEKVTLLISFKGHVKKELVNVPSVPEYFEALIYVLDEFYLNLKENGGLSESGYKLIVLAHSSLCYLIKRVAMQSPANFDESTMTTLLFYLINGIPNEKKFWLGSFRAIEAIYLVSPAMLESCLKRLCLNDFELLYQKDGVERRSSVNKTILAVEELVRIIEKNSRNPDSLLQNFREVFVKVLDSLRSVEGEDKTTIELLKELFLKFNSVLPLNQIATEIRNELVKKYLESNSTNNSHNGYDGDQYKPNNLLFDLNQELEQITKNTLKINEQQLHNSKITTKINFSSITQLANEFQALLQPFYEPKETEKNWKLRHSSILRFRGIVNGNYPNQHPTEFFNYTKEINFIEHVSKAALSLRTTLSLSACQLIREYCEVLKSHLEMSVIDQIFITLKAILSSTKKIASQSAFHTMVILTSSIPFNTKFFQNCCTSINEKAVFTRACSSILLRIFLIRFYPTDQNENKLDNLLADIEEWLKKGITDAQTTVREPMRVTFWYYFKCYPTHAKKLLSNVFSSQLRKSIELSIPSHLNLDYQPLYSNTTSIDSSRRSSIVESILSKKFPSYALPTRSSQKASTRSTSELALRSESHPFSKDIHNLENSKFSESKEHTFRKSSAPSTLSRSFNNGSGISKENTFYDDGDEHNADFTSGPLDLTSDFTNNNSNTILKKFMEINKHENSLNNTDHKLIDKDINSLDDDTFYSSLKEVNTTIALRKALQILKDKLINKTTFNFEKAMSILNKSMIRSPKEFAVLLDTPEFYNKIPLKQTVDLYAINELDAKDLIEKFSRDELVETISNLLKDVVSQANINIQSSQDYSLYYMRFRNVILNFCLNVLHSIFENLEVSPVDDQVLKNSLQRLTEICGRDFSESLYFDTIFQFFVKKKLIFVSFIKNLSIVSTKLKIFQEIEARGGQITPDDIISESQQDFNLPSRLNPNEIEDYKYLEMTMVNPFTQNRSTSENSVVHHHEIPNNNSETVDPDSITRKFSEMTKIVSVYQNFAPKEEAADFENQMQVDNSSEVGDVGLGDIFQSNDQEHTVKFSTEPPKIINESDKSMSNALSTLPSATNSSSSPDVTNQEQKNLNAASTDQQTHQISEGLDNFSMRSDQFAHNGNFENSLGQPVQISASMNKAISNDLLGRFPNDSVILYSVSKHVINNTADFERSFEEMKKAMAKIKSGSFTLKQLSQILNILVTFHDNTKLRAWFELEQGFADLFNICVMLLQLADEATAAPIKIVSKSILVASTLLIYIEIDDKLKQLSQQQISQLWSAIIALSGKITDFSDELFILLIELTKILITIDFFEKTEVASVLSLLATGSFDQMKVIQTVFLLSTILEIVKNDSFSPKSFHLLEIAQTVMMFCESDNTEVRLAAYEVSVALCIYLRENSRDSEIENAFKGIQPYQWKLINIMATK